MTLASSEGSLTLSLGQTRSLVTTASEPGVVTLSDSIIKVIISGARHNPNNGNQLRNLLLMVGRLRNVVPWQPRAVTLYAVGSACTDARNNFM